jgi:hypothetical protein
MRRGHPFDAKLANARLFAWFPPAFQLLMRHWLVALGANIAVLVITKTITGLRWWHLVTSWWELVLYSIVLATVISVVPVTAYRVIARRESRGTALEVNGWGETMIRTVQIVVVWTVGTYLVGWLFLQAGKQAFALLPAFASRDPIAVATYVSIAALIALFLLSPLWATLTVASLLSTAHAVRSIDNGLDAVLSSLRLAFDQMWRVFWPSYAVGSIVMGAYGAVSYLAIRFGSVGWLPLRIVDVAGIIIGAMSIAMTFVIERAYAPNLGLVVLDDDHDAPAKPARAAPAPQGQRPAGGGQAAPGGGAAAGTAQQAAAGDGAPAASSQHAAPVGESGVAPAAATADIAALIERDLRANRVPRLVALVEEGLAADAKFFAGQPDSTIALAKRIVQAGRPDLALRLLQPYVIEHRGHPHHLTGELLVANILMRDPSRRIEAASYLEQVKAAYPDEPMVDQLIKATSKPIAPAGTAT